jgi:hypothetical protein
MTAEEFLKNKGDADFRLSKSGEFISDIMIEFAKFHVEQALKEASENAEIHAILKDGNIRKYFINKDSILNAYPLTKIE